MATGRRGSPDAGLVRAVPRLQSSADICVFLASAAGASQSSAFSGEPVAEHVPVIWERLRVVSSSRGEELDRSWTGIWLTIQSSATEDEELQLEAWRCREAADPASVGTSSWSALPLFSSGEASVSKQDDGGGRLSWFGFFFSAGWSDLGRKP